MKEITQKIGNTFLYKGKEAKIFACDEVYGALEDGWVDTPGVIDASNGSNGSNGSNAGFNGAPLCGGEKRQGKSGSKKQDK